MLRSPCKESKLCIGILALIFANAYSETKSQNCTDSQLARFPGWPKDLDAHIYWVGAGDEMERATGQMSRFYDPSKPTLIFIPGWEHDTINICFRLTSKCNADVCSDGRILSKTWLDAGWNFGIFYWDQFSDKPCAMEPELDIWFDMNDGGGLGDGLKWKSYDPITEKEEARYYKAKSIGHVCADAVRQSMPDYSGPTLRFAGHSLGGQLAIACAHVLHKESQGLQPLPSRLALLDPYFSSLSLVLQAAYAKWCWTDIQIRKKLYYQEGHPRHCALAAISAVKDLWERGVVTELYKTSLLTETPALGDEVAELETLSAFSILHPVFCYGENVRVFNMECQHCAAAPLYLQRMASSHGAGLGSFHGASVESCTIPGPTCSDEEIRDLILAQNDKVSVGKRQVWEQVLGMATVDTFDDTFKRHTSRVPTNATLSATWHTIQDVAQTAAMEPTAMPGSGSALRNAGDRRSFVPVVLIVLLVAVPCCCLVVCVAVWSKLTERRRHVLEECQGSVQNCVDVDVEGSDTDVIADMHPKHHSYLRDRDSVVGVE